MDLAYYKRFRMEINLAGRDLTPPPVPSHYFFLPWEESLLDAFSQAKYLSFRDEFDANVFPCLAEFDGCRRLMAEIARKPGFLPEATWLVIHSPGGPSRPEYCGTVQGVRDKHGLGASRISASRPNTATLAWALVSCFTPWRAFVRPPSAASISK